MNLVMHLVQTHFFLIGPLNSSGIQINKWFRASERVNTSSDEACIYHPLTFRRIPWQISVKRFNFFSSGRQIAFDTNKSCCEHLFF